MSADSVGRLVERAKAGDLSAAEVDAVAVRLKNDPPDEHTYKLLYVVSRTSATRHETLVASFLDHQEEPMVARLALQTLCSFWGKASDYLPDLRRFIAGVDWDSDGYVRQVALSAAGRYLRDHHDCELLQAVYSICIDGAGERLPLEVLAQALGTPPDSLSKKYLNEHRPRLLAQAVDHLRAHCAG